MVIKVFKIFFFFVVISIIYLGCIFLREQTEEVYYALISETWIESPAQLDNAQVIEKKVPTPRGTGLRTKYFLQLNYTYKLNGKTYTGNKFCFSTTAMCSGFEYAMSDKAMAERNISELKHANFKIYYNPYDPSQSVVVKGITMYNAIVNFIIVIPLMILVFYTLFINAKYLVRKNDRTNSKNRAT